MLCTFGAVLCFQQVLCFWFCGSFGCFRVCWYDTGGMSGSVVRLPNGRSVEVDVTVSLPVVHLLRFLSGSDVSDVEREDGISVVCADPDPFLFASGVLLGIWRTYPGAGAQLRDRVGLLDPPVGDAVEGFLGLLLSDPPVRLSQDQWGLMFVLLGFLPDDVWVDFDRFLQDNKLLTLPGF